MTWFDGTFGTSMKKVESEYPIKITEDLRATSDKSRIALINGFTEKDPRLELADPHMDGKRNSRIFYHVFIGDDVRLAGKFFVDFLADGHGTNAKEVDLFRQEQDELFEYSYGVICGDMIDNQESLMQLLPDELNREKAFILPLKVFRYPCPVCGIKTLQWRGMFDICDECGWEDDGTDNEDEETTPNGEYTIHTYRNKYVQLKQKDPMCRLVDKHKS